MGDMMSKDVNVPQIKKDEIRRIGQMEFEEAIKDLEQVVNELEEGTSSLNRNIELYERGVYLRRRCAELLEHAELRLSSLEALAAETSKASSKESPRESSTQA